MGAKAEERTIEQICAQKETLMERWLPLCRSSALIEWRSRRRSRGSQRGARGEPERPPKTRRRGGTRSNQNRTFYLYVKYRQEEKNQELYVYLFFVSIVVVVFSPLPPPPAEEFAPRIFNCGMIHQEDEEKERLFLPEQRPIEDHSWRCFILRFCFPCRTVFAN